MRLPTPCLMAGALLALGFFLLPARGETPPAAVTTNAAPAAKERPPIPGRPTDAVAHARLTPWRPVFQGVDQCEGVTAKPRPLQVRALRVHLRDPGVDLLVTPSNGDAPKDVGGRTTSEFLAEFGCQAAINGSVFDVFVKQKGDPMDIEGVSLSRGDLYSPPNQWDALLVSRDKKAWIARAPVKTDGAYHGLSGFYALLLDGRNNGGMRELQPRSAVGISRNGKYLYLVTLDGRQPGYSEGATTAEAAEWMRKLGAYNALNLDGGGSTALVVAGPDGQPRLLNRTCSNPPGRERRVANHLGIFARPLPAPKP